jgi:hypothetical protein
MQNRRRFLKNAAASTTIFSLGAAGCQESQSAPVIVAPPPAPVPPPPTGESLIEDIGPLLVADPNGVKLPAGFTSRIVAESNITPTANSTYIWHGNPDGGAIFETDTGGWVYVSNSELGSNNGGVGVLEFDDVGEVINAYSILGNTNRNCAGGATPWDTWLSCEEVSRGLVWECDPFGQNPPIVHPSLGAFNHEAVAYDIDTHDLYLTEDASTGCFYRFRPAALSADGFADLTAGDLAVAIVNPADNTVTWETVPDPSATMVSTRLQVPDATKFAGGEGIVYFDKTITFATKIDNRIWAYNTETNIISILYDIATSSTPILEGVDNIALSKSGDLIIGEDGGDLELIAITLAGTIKPLLQLVGHDGSEITGPAFSPDGKRLYFSSQRGTEGRSDTGITFEISGPFHN